MTAFNRRGVQPAKFSPIKSQAKPGLTTFEGAPAFERDAKGDLFTLAAGSFFGADAFYESGNDRADRFRALVAVTTGQDPAWTARFLKWLRSEANIRTGAIVGAVEYARVLQQIAKATGEPAPLHEDTTARAVVRSVLQRADEPGEMLAYYTSRYGRSVPIAVKRGIADAIVGHKVVRPLYSEYTALKYDTSSHAWRFADVLEVVHPAGEHPEVKGTKTATLFRWLVNRRHNRVDGDGPLDLDMVRTNADFRRRVAETPDFLLHSDSLKDAGLTWEDALSLAGDRVPKAKLWEAMIPSMGYMARLRNLRNFDQAGVSDTVALRVAQELADPNRVGTSRQLPFRFWSAYKAAPSLRWGYALEQALDYSVQNVPELKGSTIIFTDMSGSMTNRLSDKSAVSFLEAAALFAVALAHRGADVDLVGFATGSFRHPLTRGGSVLRDLEGLKKRTGEVGMGTNLDDAIRRHYGRQSRVVVFSDMQITGGSRGYGYGYGFGANALDSVPPQVPVYAWNLAGYGRSMMETGSDNRHEFGGFSDSAFSIMQRLEAGRNGEWPF